MLKGVKNSGIINVEGMDERIHKITLFILNWLKEKIPIEMCQFVNNDLETLLRCTLSGFAKLEIVKDYFNILFNLYVENGQTLPIITEELTCYDEEQKERLKSACESLNISLSHLMNNNLDVLVPWLDVEMIQKYFIIKGDTNELFVYTEPKIFYDNAQKDEITKFQESEEIIFSKYKKMSEIHVKHEIHLFPNLLFRLLYMFSEERKKNDIEKLTNIINYFFEIGYNFELETITNRGEIISIEEALHMYGWMNTPVSELILSHIHESSHLEGEQTPFFDKYEKDRFYNNEYSDVTQYSEDDDSQWKDNPYVQMKYEKILKKHKYSKTDELISLLHSEMDYIYEKTSGIQFEGNLFNCGFGDIESLKKYFSK